MAPNWVLQLPTVNACLNGLAGVLLVVGFILIKQGKEEAHKKVMLSAFGVSILFLCSYLTYHTMLGYYTGAAHHSFPGTGAVKIVYLVILLTHLVLAMFVPFLAVGTIVSGLKGNRVLHRKLAKITFPIWLYVSVTGVIVYAMLYHFFA